jgi:exodeoxyribonuclease V alpha subunit
MMNKSPVKYKPNLAELLAKLRVNPVTQNSGAIPEDPFVSAAQKIYDETYEEQGNYHAEDDPSAQTTDRYGHSISYNSNQQEFINLASSGKSCILIGAAGTGKTTCMKGTVQSLIQNGKAGLLSSEGHKHLIDGTPGIVVCAYTRRAVANIRKNMPKDMQSNCITIHKLLEYAPVYYKIESESGEEKTKMMFEPTRHQGKPLPSSIHTIIFEESSMIGTDLYKEVQNALPHKVQEIFLGDIQQLPPVFGPAILGFKLLELPVIELTEVYRQALESPIIFLAHRILSGIGIPDTEFKSPIFRVPDKLGIRAWTKKISPETALQTLALTFCGNKFTQPDPTKQVQGLLQAGIYNPEEDIILIPFNKSCGTDELNKHIAQALARQNDEIVYEVIAGFNKYYFHVGAKVLYEKEDATIIKIEKNVAFVGARYAEASKTLDYWGHDPVVHESSGEDTFSDDAMDFVLSQVASQGEQEDRVRQCSHNITLRMNDSDSEVVINKASDVNAMLLGYCLTFHKAQGSEWTKVFMIMHQSHNTMISREMLYTAVTRAKEELIIICEPDHFMKGIQNQRIKGNTLAEKAEHFKGRLTEGFTL